MLQVSKVFKQFGDLVAVDGVSIEIQAGEFVALLGPNGAGKTTLVEMIEGIQQPDGGAITINGKNWSDDAKSLHGIIGISLQETIFLEKLKVRETMDLFASFYNVDSARVDEVLEQVNLTQKQPSMVANLSGGQRQRLAIGVAILNYPKLLLLDEPTTGLDPNARREIWRILEDLKTKHNTTLLLTTHYMEEADYLCERVIFMNGGKVLADGNKQELLQQVSASQLVRFGLSSTTEKRPAVSNALDLKQLDGGWQYRTDVPAESLNSLLNWAKDNELSLEYLEMREATLEDVFIQLSGRDLSS